MSIRFTTLFDNASQARALGVLVSTLVGLSDGSSEISSVGSRDTITTEGLRSLMRSVDCCAKTLKFDTSNIVASVYK